MKKYWLVRVLSFLAVVAVTLFFPVAKALNALLIGIVLYVVRGIILTMVYEKEEKKEKKPEQKASGKDVWVVLAVILVSVVTKITLGRHELGKTIELMANVVFIAGLIFVFSRLVLASREFRQMFELIAETAVFVFFVMTFIVQAFQIPTGSMEPTLLVGDFLLVNKFVHAPTALPLESSILPRREIRRGDIVVFKSPPDLSKDFVKRVIGLPGETLRIKDKQVTIDDKPLEEKYKVHIYPDYIMDGDNFGPVTVPAGSLFVMGDNRDNSADSRVWRFLPLTYIKGRPWVIYFSYKAASASLSPSKPQGRTTLFKEVVRLVREGRARRLFKVIR